MTKMSIMFYISRMQAKNEVKYKRGEMDLFNIVILPALFTLYANIYIEYLTLMTGKMNTDE